MGSQTLTDATVLCANSFSLHCFPSRHLCLGSQDCFLTLKQMLVLLARDLPHDVRFGRSWINLSPCLIAAVCSSAWTDSMCKGDLAKMDGYQLFFRAAWPTWKDAPSSLFPPFFQAEAMQLPSGTDGSRARKVPLADRFHVSWIALTWHEALLWPLKEHLKTILSPRPS